MVAELQLGSRIRALRQGRGLTLRDVAERSGVTESFLSQVERDVKAPPEPKLGPVRKWLENRRQAKEEKQRQIDAADEARLDDILARLHASGRDGLSEEDRRILDRVSARYRQRLNRPQ